MKSVLLCTADPHEAALRYARYTGLLARVSDSAWRIATARGYLVIVNPDTLRRSLAIEPPSLPWIAGYALESDDINATGDCLRRNGASVQVLGSQQLLVKLPPALGGVIVFEARNSGPLTFD